MGADVVSNSYGANEFGSETFADHYFDHPGRGDRRELRRRRLRRELSRGVAARRRGRRYEPPPGDRNRHAQRDRDGVGGCGQRVQRVRAQARVADRHRLRGPQRGRRVRGRRSRARACGSTTAPTAGGRCSAGRVWPRRSSVRCTPSRATRRRRVDMSSLPYATPSAFNDVVSGSNGACGGTYLCTGVAGYDGPTGLGHAEHGRRPRARRGGRAAAATGAGLLRLGAAAAAHRCGRARPGTRR